MRKERTDDPLEVVAPIDPRRRFKCKRMHLNVNDTLSFPSATLFRRSRDPLQPLELCSNRGNQSNPSSSDTHRVVSSSDSLSHRPRDIGACWVGGTGRKESRGQRTEVREDWKHRKRVSEMETEQLLQSFSCHFS